MISPAYSLSLKAYTLRGPDEEDDEETTIQSPPTALPSPFVAP